MATSTQFEAHTEPGPPGGLITVQACTHCGIPVETNAAPPIYCCPGCETAAAIIREAGLENWYAEREAAPDRPAGMVVRGWDRVPVDTLPDGTREALLRIDGLHCASCVWVTEEVMNRSAGVAEATVSYSTGRCKVRWDPEKTDLDTVLGRVAALGYRPQTLDAEVAPDRDLLLRLGVAAFAAANVMLLAISVYLGWISGMEEGYAALFRWIMLILSTPVALWSALPFFQGAWGGLRAGVLHMDLPVSIGVVVLYGHGLVATFAGQDAYLDSLTMLVAFLLVGRLLEQRGRRRAAEAAGAMAAQAPRMVRRQQAGKIQEVSLSELNVGDLIEVATGEEIGADGTIVDGQGHIQLALLTGESAPVPVGPGDSVVTGAVLLEGNLTVRAEAAAGESLLARMAAGLAAAGDRLPARDIIDRVAPIFTGATLILASLTFFGWWLLGDTPGALHATIAVLVVACPCALSLARPLAITAGLGAAARRGLLLRTGDGLLALAEIDTVVLDKTGTLTGGRPVVVEAEDAVLRVAAGLERASIHPIARAIVEAAVARQIPIPAGEQIREIAGEGITGLVDGARIRVSAGGPGLVRVERNGLMYGQIRLEDTVREDAARAVAAMKSLGLQVRVLTGDHPGVARQIAHAVGIELLDAGVGPEGKASLIHQHRAAGHKVLFIGDGLNDGPALSAADVGIAMGSGAASSVLVADGVVARTTLGPIIAGIRASRAAKRALMGNVRRSVIYNLSAVAAAALGLVNPLVAAVLMPLSSSLVVLGALSVERAVAREQAVPTPMPSHKIPAAAAAPNGEAA